MCAAFTEALRAGLADDPRVIGLVAVGSMANRDHAPDAWSDDDCFALPFREPERSSASRGSTATASCSTAAASRSAWQRSAPSGAATSGCSGCSSPGALVAYGRARRGELLRASFFVVQTLRHLTALLGDAPILDDLDPLRRLERAYPELGLELASIVRRPPATAAVARRPELGWAGFDAVRRAVASG